VAGRAGDRGGHAAAGARRIPLARFTRVDSDWALVRLNSAPPANTVFSAWRADAILDSTAVTVIHHPEGDLKKISDGSKSDYFSFSDNTSFARVRYATGATEPGSSGAGLLTLGSSGSFYELRGGLYAGTPKDTQTPYVRVFLGFLGITDVQFVFAEGLAISDEHRNNALAQAHAAIEDLVGSEALAA